MDKKKYIFYHIFLYDKINPIVKEQLDLLISNGLIEQSELYVTIMDDYKGIYKLNENNLNIINRYAKEIYKVNENLYEFFTIEKLYELSTLNEGNYLYIHTKGCTRVNDQDGIINLINLPGKYYYSYKNIENWRQIMNHFTIEQFEICNQYLNNGFDLAGCNYYKRNDITSSTAHYSGNFWWASSNFIKKLPNPNEYIGTNRLHAESWIGRIPHKAVCLFPIPKELFRGVVYTDPKNYINNIIMNEYYN